MRGSRALAVWLDRLAVLALLVAAVLLAWPAGSSRGRIAIPLLLPSDEPGSLHRPGGDERLLAARVAALGEVITIEDLVRAVVALDEERAGLPPVDAAERAVLAALVARAQVDRDALLALEVELAAARDRLDAAGRDMAGALSPEQQRWIEEHRDETSVLDVEAPYWDRARSTAP